MCFVLNGCVLNGNTIGLNSTCVIMSECCDRLKAVSVLLNNVMLQIVCIYSSHHGTLDFFTSLD